MLVPLRRLLTEASSAKQPRTFWQAVCTVVSDWADGARAELRYTGVRESGAVTAGPPERTGHPLTVEWSDSEGRCVELTLVGAPPGLSLPDLQTTLELAAQLAIMVGRRSALEHERRLGAFLVELSRWLLAAPELDLLLRYTLQSLMSLAEAQGAYVALKEPDGERLRVMTAVGGCGEFAGALLPLDASTTGRVVRTGEALISDDMMAEPDSFVHPSTAQASAAMIAPLSTSRGVVGAAGVIRYRDAAGEPAARFAVNDLHYFTAVAAHIAGGVELSQAVAATRAAANRARAMVEASPLPMALVDRTGLVHQVNQAALRVFGVKREHDAQGRRLEHLGLSPSEVTLRLILEGPRDAEPWHGRVLVTQPGGDRRICDCTVTGLSRLDSQDLLVALYDRTDELRVQRDLIAREKLATVGEIASGVAHEVNNPLAAIRMEAELLARARKDDADTTAATSAIVHEVDRAARIVRSLLRLARRSDTTPTRVQLNELVRDVVEIRQRVLRPENVEFRVALDQAAPPVLALGQELQQVVINLATNAEHAVRGRRPAVIQLSTQSRDGWVRLTVEDSGPGVPEPVRNRIFDPFFTTKGPDEGTGLGLTICQRVVAEVGGKIWLEESALGGAKFMVEIPAAPERPDSVG
ncbi:MAG: GAF domain-containing protein [Gemmatimonadetes bacterium]|nr:GAF domain-containing protein [Gemmatimonadota bacterium]